MKHLVIIGFLFTTSATAAPYYVGENLGQPDHVNFGFVDTPSKSLGSRQAGNIATIRLSGTYNIFDNAAVHLGIPFFFADDKATGTKSQSTLGNIDASLAWWESTNSEDQRWTVGYGFSAGFYAPTARKNESNTVAMANPTIDLYRYRTRGTSVVPMAHVFLGMDQFTFRLAFGGGYTMVQSKGNSPVDRNRLAVNWQNAFSWEFMPDLVATIEYNTIFLDTVTRTEDAGYASTVMRAQFRSAISPSFTGHWNQFMGSVFATIPLDSPTADYTNFIAGFNAGYTF